MCVAHRRIVPIAAVACRMIGDATSAADHVRNLRNSVDVSDVDLLGNLDGVIDLDAEITDRTLDLGVSEQLLDCA